MILPVLALKIILEKHVRHQYTFVPTIHVRVEVLARYKITFHCCIRLYLSSLMQLTSDGFACNCVDGYTGSLCDIFINGCDSVDCLNEGTCYVS